MRTSTRMVVLGFKGVLDLISVIVSAAYGLRRLSRSWTGAAIRVMRTSDDAELDIGFIGEDLDVFTLLAFVGSANGEIVIWYDQSGNGRHAVSMAGLRPRIVSNGALITENGKTTIYFAGAGQFLKTAPSVMFPTAFTANVVADVLVNSDYNSLISKTGVSNTNFASPFDLWGESSSEIGRFYYGNGNDFFSVGTNPALFASLPLSTWTMQGSASAGADVFVNGVNAASIDAGTTSLIAYEDEGSPLYIGQRVGGGTKLNGYISEVLTFPSVLSTTDRQILGRNQGSYYNITVA